MRGRLPSLIAHYWQMRDVAHHYTSYCVYMHLLGSRRGREGRGGEGLWVDSHHAVSGPGAPLVYRDEQSPRDTHCLLHRHAPDAPRAPHAPRPTVLSEPSVAAPRHRREKDTHISRSMSRGKILPPYAGSETNNNNIHFLYLLVPSTAPPCPPLAPDPLSFPPSAAAAEGRRARVRQASLQPCCCSLFASRKYHVVSR